VNRVVLDASAVLAVLNGEAGAEHLTSAILQIAVCSTVNLAEVQGKLVKLGMTPNTAWEASTSPIREAVPFTAAHAKIAGSLLAETGSLGLSLGDRACLALGIALKAPIYTADRSWKKLSVGANIHLIR
jgi:PIN domain nuclease of toxin-antitoxin system